MGLKEKARGLLAVGVLASTLSVIDKPTADKYHIHTGVNLTSFDKSDFNDERKQAIDKIAEQQYSHIVINPIFLQDSLNSDYIDEMLFSYNHMEKLIDYAHLKGLSVIMKPLVNTRTEESRKEIFPEDIDKWFEGYMTHMERLADFSERSGVEGLVIATELDSLLIIHPQKFSLLAEKINERFYGETSLSFIFNYDLDTMKVGLVDRMPVDIIGIDFYPFMYHADSKKDGPYEALYYLNTISNVTNKPIVVTEVGYRNDENAVRMPMYNPEIKGNRDDSLQAKAFKNFLWAFNNADRKYKGLMVWTTDAEDYSKDILRGSNPGSIPVGYSIFGKDAEKALHEYNKKRYYKRYMPSK